MKLSKRLKDFILFEIICTILAFLFSVYWFVIENTKELKKRFKDWNKERKERNLMRKMKEMKGE